MSYCTWGPYRVTESYRKHCLSQIESLLQRSDKCLCILCVFKGTVLPAHVRWILQKNRSNSTFLPIKAEIESCLFIPVPLSPITMHFQPAPALPRDKLEWLCAVMCLPFLELNTWRHQFHLTVFGGTAKHRLANLGKKCKFLKSFSSYPDSRGWG